MTTRRILAAAASLLVVALPLAACTSTSSTSESPGAPLTAPEPQADAGSTESRVIQAEPGQQQQEQPRDVVRTATLSVVVGDPEAAGTQIEQATTAAGGYVASVNSAAQPCEAEPCPADSVTSGAETTAGRLTITVRVPAARYDAVLADIRKLGDVAALSVTADDVTAKATDLDARIVSQRASVQRMRELLQQANTIDEMVRVEGELAQRQSDLESMVSQRKRLADQVSLATISATLVAADQADAILPPEPHWWDDPWNTFTESWRNLVIALAAVAPLLIVLGIGGAIVLVLLRRQRSQRAAPAPNPEPEPAAEQPAQSA